MTICIDCKQEKGNDFRLNRRVCRECDNKLAREKRLKDKEKEKPEFIICKKCNEKKTNFRINRASCLDCERKHGREYRQTTDKAKEWVENNREKMSELQHKWYSEHKDEIKDKKIERLALDSQYLEIEKHRGGCRIVLKGGKSRYLDCDSSTLRNWFQYQFQNGMTFDNYADLWTIDHVMPIDLFMKGIISQNICFHWMNLQPVLKKDNLRKNKHVTLEECQQHLDKANLYIRTRKLEMSKDKSDYLGELTRFCQSFAKHQDAGTTLDNSDTTSLEKSLEGTRLITEPNGNKSE